VTGSLGCEPTITQFVPTGELPCAASLLAPYFRRRNGPNARAARATARLRPSIDLDRHTSSSPFDSRANRIAFVDPIIEAFRQQRRLLAIRPLNKTLHHFPRRFSKGIISIDGVFTQPGPEADLALVFNLHCTRRFDAYSINSSARSRNASGMVSLIALAVLAYIARLLLSGMIVPSSHLP
jgi:hypothetical protein